MRKEKDESYLEQVFVTQTHGYLDISQKRELQKQIGKEINGTFKVAHTAGREFEILKLYITHGGYEIILSESDTRPLKFEIIFDSYLTYELVLSWKDTLDKLLKKIGKRGIEIGNAKFDDHYLIKSKDKGKTLNLLTRDIVENLLKHDVYSLSYTTNTKQKKSYLVTTINRKVKDKKVILDLIELHKLLVDNLLKLHIVK